MSDRLNLQPTPKDWADVNVSEHPTLEAAILVFQGLPGPHKMSGTQEQILAAYSEWKRLYDDEDRDVYMHPDSASWMAVAGG